MGEQRDNLTEIIHLRVSLDTKAWYEKYAKDLGISVAATERLALEMFRKCGGVTYANEDD